MDIRELSKITIDLHKSIVFEGDIEFSYFRTEKMKGKRIKENEQWKQVPDTKTFKVDKILGFRPLNSYDVFFKHDIAAEYQDKIDSCCIMGYIDESYKIKEYIVLNSFEEMSVLQHHIEKIQMIVNMVVDSHELTIREEIKNKIDKYINS